MNNPKQRSDLKAMKEALMKSGFITPFVEYWHVVVADLTHHLVRTNFPYNPWGNEEHCYLIGDYPPRYPVPSVVGEVSFGQHSIVVFNANHWSSDVICWWLKQHRSITDEGK